MACTIGRDAPGPDNNPPTSGSLSLFASFGLPRPSHGPGVRGYASQTRRTDFSIGYTTQLTPTRPGARPRPVRI